MFIYTIYNLLQRMADLYLCVPLPRKRRDPPEPIHPPAKRARIEEEKDYVVHAHLKQIWPGGIPSGANDTSTEGVYIVYNIIRFCSTYEMSLDIASGLAMLFLAYFIRSGTPLAHSLFIVLSYFGKYGVSGGELQHYVRAEEIQRNHPHYMFTIELGGEHRHILYMLCNVVMFAIIDSFNGSANVTIFTSIIKLLFELVNIYKDTTPRHQLFSTWEVTADGLQIIMHMFETHPHIHILGTLMNGMSATIQEHKRIYGVPDILGTTVMEYVQHLCKGVPHVSSINIMLKAYGVQPSSKKRRVAEQALADYIAGKIAACDGINFRQCYAELVVPTINVPKVLTNIILEYVGTNPDWYTAMHRLFAVLAPDHLQYFAHLAAPIA